jgi:hypothetical protein
MSSAEKPFEWIFSFLIENLGNLKEITTAEKFNVDEVPWYRQLVRDTSVADDDST